jgi:hypothetical protein
MSHGSFDVFAFKGHLINVSCAPTKPIPFINMVFITYQLLIYLVLLSIVLFCLSCTKRAVLAFGIISNRGKRKKEKEKEIFCDVKYSFPLFWKCDNKLTILICYSL